MKIIALMPVKNEAWILRTCLSSISMVADEIVALDDGSIDETPSILNAFKCNVIRLDQNEHYVDMSLRRRKLLAEGRKRGGTHFIWLDADEAFSGNFIMNARAKIGSLTPGQKLLMRWATLWKSPSQYLNDNSVFGKSLYKDFVVCDAPGLDFDKKFLSESRTPGKNDNFVKVDESEGVVLHFQFAAWDRTQMKQAWYRCSELVEGSRSAKRINNTYAITLDSEKYVASPVPLDWLNGPDVPTGIEKSGSSWHHDAIFAFFDKYGIEFFEPLQIWHVEELRAEFLKRVGREPKAKTFNPLLIRLNNFKNKIRNSFL